MFSPEAKILTGTQVAPEEDGTAGGRGRADHVCA